MSEQTAVKMTAADVSWQHYPLIDAALVTESPAVLASMEKTCRMLDHLLQTGTEREKERARAALVAYSRALELYHRLAGLRDDALQTASNIRG